VKHKPDLNKDDQSKEIKIRPEKNSTDILYSKTKNSLIKINERI
jgi:hypothetical protein